MYLTNNTTQCNVYRHGLNKEKDRQWVGQLGEPGNKVEPCVVSSPNRVWGEAPAEIDFGIF